MIVVVDKILQVLVYKLRFCPPQFRVEIVSSDQVLRNGLVDGLRIVLKFGGRIGEALRYVGELHIGRACIHGAVSCFRRVVRRKVEDLGSPYQGPCVQSLVEHGYVLLHYDLVVDRVILFIGDGA